MFPAEAVKVVKGTEYVKRISLSDSNFFKTQLGRSFCKECGFRLFNEPSNAPFRGMPASNVEGLTFQPAMHGFCADASEETLKRFSEDGLPKFKDSPKDMGGSGEQIQV